MSNIDLVGDIVNVGVCICFRKDHKLSSNQQISISLKLVQIILAWLTILIQISLTYELLTLSDSQATQNENPTSSIYFWAGFILITLQTSTDIHNHIKILWYSLIYQNNRTQKIYLWNNIILIFLQIYQSILASFVAYNIVLQQNGLLNIMINYAGILVIIQIDNYVGEWFLTQLDKYEDLMKFEIKENEENYHHANVMIRSTNQILTLSIIFMISINFMNVGKRNWLIENQGSISFIVLATIVFGIFSSIILVKFDWVNLQSQKEENHEFYQNDIQNQIKDIVEKIQQKMQIEDNCLQLIQQSKQQLENQQLKQILIKEEQILKNKILGEQYIQLLDICKQKIEILFYEKEIEIKDISIIDDPLNLKFEQFKLKNFLHLQEEIMIKQIQDPNKKLSKIQKFKQDRIFINLLNRYNDENFISNENSMKSIEKKIIEMQAIKHLSLQQNIQEEINLERCKVCDKEFLNCTSQYYSPFKDAYYCIECIENDDNNQKTHFESDTLLYISAHTKQSDQYRKKKQKQIQLFLELNKDFHYKYDIDCYKCEAFIKGYRHLQLFSQLKYLCSNCFRMVKNDRIPQAILNIEFKEETTHSIYLNVIALRAK